MSQTLKVSVDAVEVETKTTKASPTTTPDKNNRVRKPRSQSFDSRGGVKSPSQKTPTTSSSNKTPKAGAKKPILEEKHNNDDGDDEKKNNNNNNNNDNLLSSTHTYDSNILIELPLNDPSKKVELNNAFKEFQEALTAQENLLASKFSNNNGGEGGGGGGGDDPNKNNKMLLIDKHGTLTRIRQIGLITGKKFEELETEQNLAIEKLKEILKFETDVNSQHKKALELQSNVDQEIQVIQEKQAIVDAELAKVQPAIDEARKAVGSTTKADWNELRTYKNPKDVLKAVMTVAVALVKNDPKILAGSKKSQKSEDNWSEVKREVNYDLVKQLTNFLDNNQAETLDAEVVSMIKEYLQSATYEQAVNASKVAGPVFLWIRSVIFYSELVVKIKPLKEQIRELQAKLADRKDEMIQLKVQEKELADKIRKCRGEMLEMVGYKKIGSLYFM